MPCLAPRPSGMQPFKTRTGLLSTSVWPASEFGNCPARASQPLLTMLTQSASPGLGCMRLWCTAGPARGTQPSPTAAWVFTLLRAMLPLVQAAAITRSTGRARTPPPTSLSPSGALAALIVWRLLYCAAACHLRHAPVWCVCGLACPRHAPPAGPAAPVCACITRAPARPPPAPPRTLNPVQVGPPGDRVPVQRHRPGHFRCHQQPARQGYTQV